MRATLHATRSYMAGVGTSGSLVAGAALLFLLASAIVAFRGWPQIATGPSMTSVSAARLPSAPSPAHRRLTVLLRRPAAVIGVARPGGRAGRAARAGHRSPSRASVLATRTPPLSRSTPRGGNAGPAASPASSGSGSCGASSCTSPQTTVKHLANTVTQQVTNIGSEVGSQVGSTSSTVAEPVSGVSPQGGSVVQSAGNTAGNVISGTTTTAGNAVSQAGSALSGGH